MVGNLDAYHKAQTRLEATDRRVSALVAEIEQCVGPFFRDWRKCYPITSPADGVPPLLMRVDQGGPVQPMDVAGLPSLWVQVQTAMAEFAHAREAAIAVTGRLTPDEQARVGRVGTTSESPARRSGSTQPDPSRFRVRR